MGTERIVYGDKVINLSNHRRVAFPEGGALNFLANGEIGIAVGQFAPNGNPSFLNVEFTSQKGFTYGFRDRDFRDEGDAALGNEVCHAPGGLGAMRRGDVLERRPWTLMQHHHSALVPGERGV